MSGTFLLISLPPSGFGPHPHGPTGCQCSSHFIHASRNRVEGGGGCVPFPFTETSPHSSHTCFYLYWNLVTQPHLAIREAENVVTWPWERHDFSVQTHLLASTSQSASWEHFPPWLCLPLSIAAQPFPQRLCWAQAVSEQMWDSSNVYLYYLWGFIRSTPFPQDPYQGRRILPLPSLSPPWSLTQSYSWCLLNLCFLPVQTCLLNPRSSYPATY